MVSALREFDKDLSIDLASFEPYVSKHTISQMSDLSIDKNLSIQQAIDSVKNGDYSFVSMAGGPLMSSIDEVLDILKLFSVSKSFGARVSIAGCGLGPLTSNYRDKAIHRIFQLSDSILLRDQNSVDLACSTFKLKQNLKVGIDPAFHWIKKVKITEPLSRGNNVLFALRDWPIDEYATNLQNASKIKLKFENELIKFKEKIKKNHCVVPFSMHKYAIGNDDRFYHYKLWKSDDDILKESTGNISLLRLILKLFNNVRQ